MTSHVRNYLTRADMPVEAGTFVRVVALAVLCAWVIAQLVGVSALGQLCLVMGPALAAALYVRTRVQGRPSRLVSALPDPLRSIAAGVASGMSFRQALGRVAHDTPGPLGTGVATHLRRSGPW